MSSVDYFNLAVDCSSKYTGLNRGLVSQYFMHILVFDFLICNGDRHLSNIEFIYNEYTNTWRLSPIFDNGDSFFGKDGSLTNSQMEQEFRRLKMKPFSSNPYKNLIDLGEAKKIALWFKGNIESVYGSINGLPINDAHKKVIKTQFERLLNR